MSEWIVCLYACFVFFSRQSGVLDLWCTCVTNIKEKSEIETMPMPRGRGFTAFGGKLCFIFLILQWQKMSQLIKSILTIHVLNFIISFLATRKMLKANKNSNVWNHYRNL